MSQVSEYLKSEYDELILNKRKLEDELTSISYEIIQTEKTIDRLSDSSSDEDVFSMTTQHYDSIKFSEYELKELRDSLEELKSRRVVLLSDKDRIDKKIESVKKAIAITSINEDMISDIAVTCETRDKVISELNDVIGKLEFVKKINVCDSNRAGLEIDKLVRKIKRISKMLV